MPQPGWWERNWKWFVPVASVTGVLLIAGAIFLFVFSILNLTKTSQPCKDAMLKASANPEVQAELGTPIKMGFMVSGNISMTNSNGHASIQIPISGPKGDAQVFVEGNKSAGTWTYSTMEVAFPGKPARLKLLP